MGEYSRLKLLWRGDTQTKVVSLRLAFASNYTFHSHRDIPWHYAHTYPGTTHKHTLTLHTNTRWHCTQTYADTAHTHTLTLHTNIRCQCTQTNPNTYGARSASDCPHVGQLGMCSNDRRRPKVFSKHTSSLLTQGTRKSGVALHTVHRKGFTTSNTTLSNNTFHHLHRESTKVVFHLSRNRY